MRGLVEAGTLQLSLFDERDLIKISSADYPGERLVVRRNPLPPRRKRGELLEATERQLDAKRAACQQAAGGKDKIAHAVGRVIDHYKMAKHFNVTRESRVLVMHSYGIFACFECLADPR